ncbi:ATP synthase subunit K, mitochondrial [Cytospora mali]|uniref:ATP synthase subunit K, mitochondrial n=1 Tax=Cytospora mali TaxID=578113 RepID=A0A194UQ10_CYTMA|nr:ATP synthase subunit K, mitochondrial [Valsa mali var. pyri (nom. inval.)]
MVQYYNLFGAKVGSHYLAMGVLAALFGGSSLALGGGSKKATQAPPINASSPDEADFIKKFLDEAEADSKSKEKH